MSNLTLPNYEVEEFTKHLENSFRSHKESYVKETDLVAKKFHNGTQVQSLQSLEQWGG